MDVRKPVWMAALAATVILCALAATALAQENDEDKAVTAVVEKLFAALNRADVDTALDCFMFPLLAIRVPETAELPPEQNTFDTAEDLRPEIDTGATNVELKDVKLVYRRGPIAAVSGTVAEEGNEVGQVLFVLGKSLDKGWQIKVIFIPG